MAVASQSQNIDPLRAHDISGVQQVHTRLLELLRKIHAHVLQIHEAGAP